MRISNNRGASVPEYVVLLLIALAIILTLFWSSLAKSIGQKLSEIGLDIPKKPATEENETVVKGRPGSKGSESSSGGGSGGPVESYSSGSTGISTGSIKVR